MEKIEVVASIVLYFYYVAFPVLKRRSYVIVLASPGDRIVLCPFCGSEHRISTLFLKFSPRVIDWSTHNWVESGEPPYREAEHDKTDNDIENESSANNEGKFSD